MASKYRKIIFATEPLLQLPVLSAREVVKGLKNQEFQVVSQKCSHIKMKKKTSKEAFVVIIPDYMKSLLGL